MQLNLIGWIIINFNLKSLIQFLFVRLFGPICNIFNALLKGKIRRGKVLDFSLQNGGLITAEDGQRYHFEPSEWKEQSMPVRGMLVDFDTNG